MQNHDLTVNEVMQQATEEVAHIKLKQHFSMKRQGEMHPASHRMLKLLEIAFNAKHNHSYKRPQQLVRYANSKLRELLSR